MQPVGCRIEEFNLPFTGQDRNIAPMTILLGIMFFMVYQTTPTDQYQNIIFEGRLLEMPSEAPRCGDIKVAVAYKFKVEKVVSGKSKKKSLAVLIPCPDLNGDNFFEVNSVYYIEASTNLEEAGSYTIYNNYFNSILFWSINIRKLESVAITLNYI